MIYLSSGTQAVKCSLCLDAVSCLTMSSQTPFPLLSDVYLEHTLAEQRGSVAIENYLIMSLSLLRFKEKWNEKPQEYAG